MTDKDRKLIEEWLQPCAVVPIETATVRILLNALRERLAQPEPPVLTGIDCSCGKKWRILNNTLTASEPETVMAEYKHQTYAAYKTGGEMKIGVVPEQEPVAWMDDYNACKCPDNEARCFSDKVFRMMQKHTTPPRREWVGLTADEIWKCNAAPKGSAVEYHICMAHQNVLDFAEAIEAKLKEKNT